MLHRDILVDDARKLKTHKRKHNERDRCGERPARESDDARGAPTARYGVDSVASPRSLLSAPI